MFCRIRCVKAVKLLSCATRFKPRPGILGKSVHSSGKFLDRSKKSCHPSDGSAFAGCCACYRN